MRTFHRKIAMGQILSNNLSASPEISLSIVILIPPLGNGTVDFIPYISASCALDFREWLGGEEVINDYCHRIALEGGKRLAQILGTEIIDEAQGFDFTLNMV